MPHHRVAVTRPGVVASTRGRTARARTVSPLRQASPNVGVHIYGLNPTESAAAPPPAGNLRQGEAVRLQGKLQSAELRAVGLGETIKVLEASLKVKDDTITRLEGMVSVCHPLSISCSEHANVLHCRRSIYVLLRMIVLILFGR